MPGKSPVEIVKNYYDAAGRHDSDALAATLDPKIVVDDPIYPEPPKGREGMRNGWKSILKAFPDSEFRLLNIAASGDMVAAEIAFGGTFKNPLETARGTINPTGRRMQARWAVFFRVNSEGLISELRAYYHDLTRLRRELGLKA